MKKAREAEVTRMEGDRLRLQGIVSDLEEDSKYWRAQVDSLESEIADQGD